MGDISAEAHEGRIRFSLSEGTSSGSSSIDPSEAEMLALHLLDLVGELRGPQTQSLMEQIPMVSQHNPQMEYAQRDDGKLLLALGLCNWRPIYLILDSARVVDLGSLPLLG